VLVHGLHSSLNAVATFLLGFTLCRVDAIHTQPYVYGIVWIRVAADLDNRAAPRAQKGPENKNDRSAPPARGAREGKKDEQPG
jgi:hypothetical protein